MALQWISINSRLQLQTEFSAEISFLSEAGRRQRVMGAWGGGRRMRDNYNYMHNYTQPWEEGRGGMRGRRLATSCNLDIFWGLCLFCIVPSSWDLITNMAKTGMFLNTCYLKQRQSALGVISYIASRNKGKIKSRGRVYPESASSQVITNKWCQECLVEPIANFSDWAHIWWSLR